MRCVCTTSRKMGRPFAKGVGRWRTCWPRRKPLTSGGLTDCTAGACAPIDNFPGNYLFLKKGKGKLGWTHHSYPRDSNKGSLDTVSCPASPASQEMSPGVHTGPAQPLTKGATYTVGPRPVRSPQEPAYGGKLGG